MAYASTVRDELLRMRDQDQESRLAVIRGEVPAASAEGYVNPWDAMDREHATRVAEIIAAYGWPVLSQDGREVAFAVWLLVQHAAHDPSFQRRCLDMMTDAFDAGEADPRLWATLTDRVLLKETGMQRFGTQWMKTGVTGDWVLQPLTEPHEVDARRAGVGLGLLEENKRAIERTYGAGWLARGTRRT